MKGLKGKQRSYVSVFALDNSYSGHTVESGEPKKLTQDPRDRFLMVMAVNGERSIQIQRN